MLVINTDHKTPVADDGKAPQNQNNYTDDVCTIEQPTDGETVSLTLDPNVRYDFKVDLSQVKSVTQDGTTLACTFDDNSKIVFENAVKADTQNEILEAHDKFVSSMAIIDQLTALLVTLDAQPGTHTEYASVESKLAFEVANIEPSTKPDDATDNACGPYDPTGTDQQLLSSAVSFTDNLGSIEPSAGNTSGPLGGTDSGYGFQSRADDASLKSLGAIGPIAPTALNYHAEFYQPQGLDTSHSSRTSITTNTALTVSAQAADLYIKEDGQGFAPLTASFHGGSGNNVMTLTVTGVDPSWTVTAAGWTHNADGSYTLTLPQGQQDYTGAFTFKPPADSDADMTGLHFTASVHDTSGNVLLSDTKDFSVLVDAVVDTPLLTVSDHIDQAWYAWTSHYETPLNITSNVTDKDGSETITKIVIDLSAPFTNGADPYHSLVDMGITLNKGTEISPGVWEITVNNGDAATALAGLNLVLPGNMNYWAIHSAEIGEHDNNIVVTSYVAETNTHGQEWDLSDNATTVVQNIHLNFRITPLALDLDGNGVEVILMDAGVKFDMNNNGTLDKTSWIGKHDGLLALDSNHDGLINNQSELFGNSDTTRNGFENLAQYDSNHDGRIDAQDGVFKDLIVWRDDNQDGISQPGEKLSLSDFNIVAINLNATDSGREQGDSIITQEGTFVYADGSHGQIVDVAFNTQEISGENNTLYGSSKADDFVLHAVSKGLDVIKDFSVNEGDVLDFSNFFHKSDDVQQSIENFVFAREMNGGTVISVDTSGSGNAQNAVDVVALQGVHDVTVHELAQNGNIHIM